ncbi:MAG: hypothetical protein EP301_13830 [Gammaproteobacteria bacterium]|jgi:hypothetical protein|nr:MAG: hypothetical protein EP301_13830 [Gammaproteobacteria bacterium]
MGEDRGETAPHEDGVLQLAAATTDLDAARALVSAVGGTLYADERSEWQHLPFRGLITLVTDDPDLLTPIGDVGVYLVYRRLKKAGEASALGLFPMVRAPGLSHQEADAHWRDVHGPLALTHHGFMNHYTQLSVVQNLSGLPLDGFALCGFASEKDLRERFYSTEDGPAVIGADVARFSDLKRSPRRLIVSEERFLVG